MTDKETEIIVEVARRRGEMEFLFQITKAIAESDSIGEGIATAQAIRKKTSITEKGLEVHSTSTYKKVALPFINYTSTTFIRKPMLLHPLNPFGYG